MTSQRRARSGPRSKVASSLIVRPPVCLGPNAVEQAGDLVADGLLASIGGPRVAVPRHLGLAGAFRPTNPRALAPVGLELLGPGQLPGPRGDGLEVQELGEAA